MTNGFDLLAKAVDTDLVTFMDIDERLFYDDELVAYVKIREYVAKYGKLPGKKVHPRLDTTETPKEDLEYLNQSLKERRVRLEMATNLPLIAKLTDPEKALDGMRELLQDLGSTKKQVISSMHEDVQQRIRAYTTQVRKKGRVGIPTGFDYLDDQWGGWRDGTFTAMVGRPGTKKTWWLLAHALAVEKYLVDNDIEGDVPIFSLEIPKMDIMERLDCARSMTNYIALTAGNLSRGELKHLNDTVLGLTRENTRIKVITNVYHLPQMFSLVQSMNAKWMGIDGIYLASPSDKKLRGWEKMTDVTREAKQGCMETGIPLAATTQQNRSEKGSKKAKNSQDVQAKAAFSDSFNADTDNALYSYVNEELEWEEKIGVQSGKVRRGSQIDALFLASLSKMKFGYEDASNYLEQ